MHVIEEGKKLRVIVSLLAGVSIAIFLVIQKNFISISPYETIFLILIPFLFCLMPKKSSLEYIAINEKGLYKVYFWGMFKKFFTWKELNFETRHKSLIITKNASNREVIYKLNSFLQKNEISYIKSAINYNHKDFEQINDFEKVLANKLVILSSKANNLLFKRNFKLNKKRVIWISTIFILSAMLSEIAPAHVSLKLNMGFTLISLILSLWLTLFIFKTISNGFYEIENNGIYDLSQNYLFTWEDIVIELESELFLKMYSCEIRSAKNPKQKLKLIFHWFNEESAVSVLLDKIPKETQLYKSLRAYAEKRKIFF